MFARSHLLAIRGDTNDHKNVGHIWAFESVVPVDEWSGATDDRVLYNHEPCGQGFDEGDAFPL